VVIIYAQAPSGNSLWKYAVRRGWEPQVVSNPDVLARLVRAGKVEIVLCSSLKRLGRNSSHFEEVLRDLVSRKVVLIIPAQGIDTSKVPGEVILRMLDSTAEFKRGIAGETKARGVKLCRRETAHRYRADVARLRAQGLTGCAIARKLVSRVRRSSRSLAISD
jgi:DNA invertase Pin-like site-specific DNA recombinase